ncbi:hypothetical protein V9T40_004054 [Parthenolecanium corni]|uniref:Queuine tRNA-ribosyltransferase accessory subunit 2 n=1 Tax=Parthenolecanium corni TaxID=536013 RepID=A0AAN9TVE7_9HEMI
MKFKLHQFNKLRGRLGSLSDVERLPDFSMDTPNIFLYTTAGCIPNLTYDVLQKITTNVFPMQYPLNTLYRITEAIKLYKKALHSFVGQPEYVSYCCIQDPLYSFPRRKHKLELFTLNTIGGIEFISYEKYMEIMEDFQPDIYVSPSDCDTSIFSSTKRTCNSVNITNRWFENVYKIHESSPILKNKGLIAAVAGGYDLMLRERCAKYMSEFPVLGYLIDGLFTDEIAAHEVPIDSVMKIISHTVNFLPEERLRIVHGSWDPETVLKMVKSGIDIFDTSFPILNAENGRALLFNFDVPNLLDDDVKLRLHGEENGVKEETSIENGDSDIVDQQGSGDNPKKFKSSTSANRGNTKIKCENRFSIALKDTRYFDDLTPLMENCSCLTCEKHTKAYIHHLLCTNELLAPVLLTIHNLHHYIEFFRKIREHLKKQL